MVIVTWFSFAMLLCGRAPITIDLEEKSSELPNGLPGLEESSFIYHSAGVHVAVEVRRCPSKLVPSFPPIHSFPSTNRLSCRCPRPLHFLQ